MKNWDSPSTKIFVLPSACSTQMRISFLPSQNYFLIWFRIGQTSNLKRQDPSRKIAMTGEFWLFLLWISWWDFEHSDLASYFKYTDESALVFPGAYLPLDWRYLFPSGLPSFFFLSLLRSHWIFEEKKKGRGGRGGRRLRREGSLDLRTNSWKGGCRSVFAPP